MRDAVVSKSIIRNFMANASRTTCNEFLYGALQDADEALSKVSELDNELREAKALSARMKRRYEDGMKVHYQGDDADDGIECPICKCEVARNDDYADMKPKHCPDCGTKLLY